MIQEKRQFPRVTATIPIRITPEFLGETVDLSENGLRFVLRKPLLLSKAQAKIELSSEETIDTEFKVIWNKHLVKENKFTYGVCFVRLKQESLNLLREILIKTSIKDIVDKIDNDIKKQKILDFWLKDFKKYFSELAVLDTKIKEDEVTLLQSAKLGTELHNDIIKKANELESFIDNKIIAKRLKEKFRFLCGPWVYQGVIVKRAFEKPRGYPGDVGVLEAIYDNGSHSKGIGYCCDKYLLDEKYANAVRNRKDFMRNKLIDIFSDKNSAIFNILNLACGSSREIKEAMLKQNKLSKKINFTLVDQDDEALLFSKNILNSTKIENIKFKYLQHNILEYIKEPLKYSNILGKQDLIYSIGLADYLPDRVLSKIITFCYDLLNSKGNLMLAHKDISTYKPLPADWWCDWTFYPRDEKNLLSIIIKSGISKFNIKVEREMSQIIVFLTVTKQ